MSTLRRFAHKNATVPANTSWHLPDLGEFRGIQECYTRQNTANSELLQGQRAEYGKQVIAELARMLTTDFVKGWSERQLRYCLRVADIFPEVEILHTVCSQLSWSHLRLQFLARVVRKECQHLTTTDQRLFGDLFPPVWSQAHETDYFAN